MNCSFVWKVTSRRARKFKNTKPSGPAENPYRVLPGIIADDPARRIARSEHHLTFDNDDDLVLVVSMWLYDVARRHAHLEHLQFTVAAGVADAVAHPIIGVLVRLLDRGLIRRPFVAGLGSHPYQRVDVADLQLWHMSPGFIEHV